MPDLSSARPLKAGAKKQPQRLGILLHELGQQTEHDWEQYKAPMAVSWCAVAMSACHLTRLFRFKGGFSYGSLSKFSGQFTR